MKSLVLVCYLGAGILFSLTSLLEAHDPSDAVASYGEGPDISNIAEGDVWDNDHEVRPRISTSALGVGVGPSVEPGPVYPPGPRHPLGPLQPLGLRYLPGPPQPPGLLHPPFDVLDIRNPSKDGVNSYSKGPDISDIKEVDVWDNDHEVRPQISTAALGVGVGPSVEPGPRHQPGPRHPPGPLQPPGLMHSPFDGLDIRNPSNDGVYSYGEGPDISNFAEGDVWDNDHEVRPQISTAALGVGVGPSVEPGPVYPPGPRHPFTQLQPPGPWHPPFIGLDIRNPSHDRVKSYGKGPDINDIAEGDVWDNDHEVRPQISTTTLGVGVGPSVEPGPLHPPGLRYPPGPWHPRGPVQPPGMLHPPFDSDIRNPSDDGFDSNGEVPDISDFAEGDSWDNDHEVRPQISTAVLGVGLGPSVEPGPMHSPGLRHPLGPLRPPGMLPPLFDGLDIRNPSDDGFDSNGEVPDISDFAEGDVWDNDHEVRPQISTAALGVGVGPSTAPGPLHPPGPRHLLGSRHPPGQWHPPGPLHPRGPKQPPGSLHSPSAGLDFRNPSDDGVDSYHEGPDISNFAEGDVPGNVHEVRPQISTSALGVGVGPSAESGPLRPPGPRHSPGPLHPPGPRDPPGSLHPQGPKDFHEVLPPTETEFKAAGGGVMRKQVEEGKGVKEADDGSKYKVPPKKEEYEKDDEGAKESSGGSKVNSAVPINMTGARGETSDLAKGDGQDTGRTDSGVGLSPAIEPGPQQGLAPTDDIVHPDVEAEHSSATESQGVAPPEGTDLEAAGGGPTKQQKNIGVEKAGSMGNAVGSINVTGARGVAPPKKKQGDAGVGGYHKAFLVVDLPDVP